MSAHAIGSVAACYSRLNLGTTLTMAGKHQEATDRLVEVREEAARTGHSSILVALHVIRLPSLAGLGEWRTFEMELVEAERKIPEMGIVDVDLANLAQLAAERCDTLGRPNLARRCWSIAHEQWTALNRSAEAETAKKHLAV